MAKLGINTTPPLGTPLPDGGGNINSNFDELYTLLGDGNELYPGIVTSITAGSNISISTSTGNVSIAVSTSAFTETLDSVTDRGNVTNNGIRVGVVTAASFVKNGGTADQFLKADGTVDNNTYLTSSSPINLNLDDVTTNGNTTTNNIEVGSVVALGNVAAGASILAVNAAYASSFRRIGGSSTEFLKGDGTVDTNSYATVAYVDTNAGYWVQDTVGINTASNVGIGTSAGAEKLIVGGDARILGILTVGSASVTIDGDSETISVGNTVSVGNTAIHVGAGLTITQDAILVGTGITISSVTNQIFIQGEEVIDRWKIGAVGISTTNEVGIGTTAKAEYQLDVLGDTRIIGNLVLDGSTSGIVTQITAGDGISVDPISGEGSVRITAVGSSSLVGSLQQVTDNGDQTTNTITATGFIKSGGASDEFLKADGSIDGNSYATTSFLAAETSARQNADAELETKIGLSTVGLASIAYVDQEIANIGTADTTGLASIVYVDTQVGLATAGLASIVYVDNLVAISTAGLGTGGVGAAVTISDTAPGSPSEGDLWWDSTRGTGFIYYTDTNSSQWVEFCPGGAGGGGGGSSDVSKAYVDNLVAISTTGLASEDYVGLATAGISTEGLASIDYVDNLVAISTAGLGTGSGATPTLAEVTAQGNTTTDFITAQGFLVSVPSPSTYFLKADGSIDGNSYVTSTQVQSQIGLATAGLASEDYVDATEQSIITQVGSLLNMSYYTKTEVDNIVGLATVGLGTTGGGVSQSYVDNAVGLATAGLVPIELLDQTVGLATDGLATIEYVDIAVANGINTAIILTENLQVKADVNASFTIGQDVDGSNVDHFGIYYGELNGGVGSADIFTSNGNMSFWTDNGGVDYNSIFQFGRDFGTEVWMAVSDSGTEVAGIVTAASFVKNGGTSSQYLMADGSVSTGGGGGGGVPSRATLTGTTGVISAGGSTLLDITGYKTYALQSIQVTQASWVRLYTDPTSRTNDAGRAYTEDPQPGSGLIAEVRTETSGTSTFLMSPGVIGWNNNNTSNIYVSVTNNETSALTITVNLQAVQMES